MNEARTVIVGAGQAGLAVSRYLTEADHDHVLLERARVGERWRSERWDSLTLLSPNWLNELPGAWPHDDPDAFLSCQRFIDYLDRYARSFAAPVREGGGALK
jgi:putative flavoprotein involved in K+ transport